MYLTYEIMKFPPFIKSAIEFASNGSVNSRDPQQLRPLGTNQQLCCLQCFTILSLKNWSCSADSPARAILQLKYPIFLSNHDYDTIFGVLANCQVSFIDVQAVRVVRPANSTSNIELYVKYWTRNTWEWRCWMLDDLIQPLQLVIILHSRLVSS